MKMAFKKAKTAFTMAEMLMVLMVIGIISVMTITTLMKHRPDENMLRFRKAYYITEKTLANITSKDENYPHNAAQPGLLNNVVATDNGTVVEIEDSGGTNTRAENASKLCVLFTREINIVTTPYCKVGAGSQGRRPLDIGTDKGNGGNFKTVDGVVWSFPVAVFKKEPSPDARQTVVIDVNGTRKPNCTYDVNTCKDPDRFEIIILANGTITVEGEKELEALASTTRPIEK